MANKGKPAHYCVAEPTPNAYCKKSADAIFRKFLFWEYGGSLQRPITDNGYPQEYLFVSKTFPPGTSL